VIRRMFERRTQLT